MYLNLVQSLLNAERALKWGLVGYWGDVGVEVPCRSCCLQRSVAGEAFEIRSCRRYVDSQNCGGAEVSMRGQRFGI